MKFFVYMLIAGFHQNALANRLAIDTCHLMSLPPEPHYFEIEIEESAESSEIGARINQEILDYCTEMSKDLYSKFRPISVSVTKL